MTDAARRLIAERGFDPVYGARPLRRYIAHEVETRIAKALLRGDLTDGVAVRVDVRDDELVVHHDPEPAGV